MGVQSFFNVLTVIRCLLIVPFPESSLNDEAGKNFMESYDEYARRAKLLAGVHGLKGWSSKGYDGGNGGSGKKTGEKRECEGKEDEEKEEGSSNSAGSLPNESHKLGKNGSRCNIVRGSGKTLDKKSKKKSLKRL